MFFELLKKECSQTLKSLIYWLYVFCLLVFFYSPVSYTHLDVYKRQRYHSSAYGLLFGVAVHGGGVPKQLFLLRQKRTDDGR